MLRYVVVILSTFKILVRFQLLEHVLETTTKNDVE